MSLTTTTRNATISDAVAILQEQRAYMVDAVVPGSELRFKGGNLVISGHEQVLNEDGVTDVNGTYTPTDVADEGIAEKTGIPTAYLRTLRAERPDLYDVNVNSWFRGRTIMRADGPEVIYPADTRKHLVRMFQPSDGGNGILRAMLSDRYKRMDNLDALMALLAGITAAGVETRPVVSLTDRRMHVKVVAPEVQAYATELLKNYRSPFTGARGLDNPLVFAGLYFTNSEVGNGAYSITPMVEIQVCGNGMTFKADVERKVHLGAKQDSGIVEWSSVTQEKALALLTSQTTDAVRTFLDPAYMRAQIAMIEAKAGAPVPNVVENIKIIGQRLAFNKSQQAGILDHFIRGADTTAGGLMNAVTSYAQDVDADAAMILEGQAVKVLDLVPSLR